MSVKRVIVSYLFPLPVFTGFFRGVRYKRQVRTGSGRVISWINCAFTSLTSSMTGHTPCSATCLQPSHPTVATSELLRSRDTQPLQTLPSRRPIRPEALLRAAADVSRALGSLSHIRALLLAQINILKSMHSGGMWFVRGGCDLKGVL